MLDIIITVIGILALVLLWVVLYDSNRFVIRKHTISDAKIKKECRAVVLSDLHNKRYGKNNENLLAAIREQKPDFILIAGDILTAVPKKSPKVAVDLLRELAGEYPIYYGNGNHEHRLKLYPETYGNAAQEYGDALQEIGIEPLVNSHAKLPEVGLCVYGAEIDRVYYKRFKTKNMDWDYLPGLLGQAPKDSYVVLLAHNPDFLPRYADWGADLILSGHVHGGVVRVPFWGKGVISPSLRLFPQYDGGVFEFTIKEPKEIGGGWRYAERKSVMILSRGLGSHTIPVRVFNPGELWVVDFKPKN